MRVVEGAGRSAAGIGIALAALLLGRGSASADTVVPLPDGEQALTTATGIPVDLTRTGETAVLSPSLAANGMSRTTQLSGTTYAAVPGATAGSLETGYLIGCPGDPKPDTPDKPGKDGGGNNSLSAGGYAGGTVSKSGVSPYADPSMSIRLESGKVATKTIEDYSFTGTSGITQYVNHTLSVEGCAGAAEARAYTTVTVRDNVMDDSETLWGQPFGLG